MLNWLNCDQKSELHGIRIEILNELCLKPETRISTPECDFTIFISCSIKPIKYGIICGVITQTVLPVARTSTYTMQNGSTMHTYTEKFLYLKGLYRKNKRGYRLKP